jgi:hypothetical protein
VKGYKLLVGEAGNSNIEEIFSINYKTIINKRNELERQYMNEIALENEENELLSDEIFQKEIIDDFEWNHYGNKPIYINNPTVRYKNKLGEEVTETYCNFIDDEDTYLDSYKWLILKEIEILE